MILFIHGFLSIYLFCICKGKFAVCSSLHNYSLFVLINVCFLEVLLGNEATISQSNECMLATLKLYVRTHHTHHHPPPLTPHMHKCMLACLCCYLFRCQILLQCCNKTQQPPSISFCCWALHPSLFLTLFF